MTKNNSLIKIAILSILALVIVAVIAFVIIKPIMFKKDLPKPITIDTQNQPTLGNPKAKITMVAFEDLKCSNCARFNTQIMPHIKKHFIDTGIAKYIMINLAFIQGSMPAANAARCVYMQNNNLFFGFTDYLFQHQPPEDQDWATIPTLMIDAGKIKGINTDQLAQCLVKSPYDQFIQNNLKQAMAIMDKSVATPTLYINGIKVDPLTKKQIDLIIGTIR
ncbi:MAG: thioredoxin domain-containing protein [Gammaproteobacteria bacterium]|nr:thioredoxin domain-containing protein [Gammaproteobacteria bacterium]